jgi:putative oxidoreductase
MFIRLLSTNAGFGMCWIRLPLAVSMILHGYGKVTNLHGFLHYCDNIGIPPALAVLGACGEFLGGLGVLFGCLSRIAAFGVGCTMMTAALMRHMLPGYGYLMNWHGALPYGAEGYEFHTLAIGMSLAIMFLGAGRFSVDYLLVRYLTRASLRDRALDGIAVDLNPVHTRSAARSVPVVRDIAGH